MKLAELLNVIEGPTVIWIATPDNDDGVFHGFAEDASLNIPGDHLFGEVKAVYAEYYKSYNRAGISVLVEPYVSK